MKKVLSVGASIEQIESIKLAKKLGYNVIAVDGNPNSEGMKYCDEFLNIDLKNEDEIINIACENQIKAVIPSPIGKFLTIVGAINDKLNLNGISKQAALNCVDKVRFNECLKTDQINWYKQINAITKDAIKDAIKKIGTNCIIKPRFGSGSRGVRGILNEHEVVEILESHIKECDGDETLIEELIKGKEYGIDGVIKQEHLEILLVREKQLTDLPYRQEIGYICPADINKETELKIYEQIKLICARVGLKNTLLHADVIIDENGEAYVIEMSGRPAGYFLSSKVIPYVTGVNFLEEGIKLALGKKCNFTTKTKKHMGICFYNSYGAVKNMPSNEELEKIDFVYESNLKIKNGDIIDKIKSGNDVYNRGYILIIGNSNVELKNNIEYMKSIMQSSNKNK